MNSYSISSKLIYSSTQHNAHDGTSIPSRMETKIVVEHSNGNIYIKNLLKIKTHWRGTVDHDQKHCYQSPDWTFIREALQFWVNKHATYTFMFGLYKRICQQDYRRELHIAISQFIMGIFPKPVHFVCFCALLLCTVHWYYDGLSAQIYIKVNILIE